MKKIYSLTWYHVMGLVLAVYGIYFLLWHDGFSPCSIHFVLGHIHQLPENWHILLLALLPMYVALMIFALAAVGVYLGVLVERIMACVLPKKP